MNREPHPIIVFGPSGQIGSALLSRFTSGDATGVSWERVSTPEMLDRWLQSHFSGHVGGVDFVFANGVTDPKRSKDEIEFSNLKFPQLVYQKTQALGVKYCRFVTLGTIQENFEGLCRGNAYYQSKRDLSLWMEEHALKHPGSFTHLRLHTIYGGALVPHMFLGLMAKALKDDADFEMSSGQQLREYHHVQDIAQAIQNLLKTDWKQNGLTPVTALSSGEPITLAALAQAVFAAFGKPDRLKTGAISSASGENVAQVFPRSPTWLLPIRPPIPGVIEFLASRALFD